MLHFEEPQILPFSNIYKLNKFGEILDSNGKIVETEVIDTKKVINLEWVNGNSTYELAKVIAILKFNIQIPIHLWDRIEPIYNDGDPLNTNICNINYRFKGKPIEVDGLSGFYYIPYYTRYAISRIGTVYNLKTHTIVAWTTVKPNQLDKHNRRQGYQKGTMVCDFMRRYSLSRHRAMGFTFLRYESDPFKLVINHLNGIPGNDEPENLEWTTKKKNNQHAIDTGLMPNSVVTVLSKNLETGEIVKYNSITECARQLGRSPTYIYKRLAKNKHYRYYDNLVFKFDDNSDWPKVSGRVLSKTGNYVIVSRDIFTGNVSYHDNVLDASKHTNVCDQAIEDNIRNNGIIPTGGYNFRYLTYDLSWPNHSEKHLRIYRVYQRYATYGVTVTDINGTEVAFYESAKLAAEAYNLASLTITRILLRNKLYHSQYFKMYKLTENLGPPIE